MEILNTNTEQPTAAAAALPESVSPMGSAVSTSNAIIVGAAADPTTEPTAAGEAARGEPAIAAEPEDGGPSAAAAEESMEVEVVSPAAELEKPSSSSNRPGASELAALSVDSEEGGIKLDSTTKDSTMEAGKESDEGTDPVDVSKEPDNLGSGTIENQEEEQLVQASQPVISVAGQQVPLANEKRLVAYKSVHSDSTPIGSNPRKLHAAKSVRMNPAAHAAAYVDTAPENRGAASLVNVVDLIGTSTPSSFRTKRIHASKSVMSEPPVRSHLSVSSEGTRRRKRGAYHRNRRSCIC
jgi:hypothetical protein